MPPAEATTPHTRKQRRAQARAERIERERAAAARARRRRSLIRLGGVAAAALGIVAVLVVVSQEGASDTAAPGAGESPGGAAEVRGLFEGIPQRGTALGDPDAPVTLVEFADLQCPYCAQWARESLPTLVEDYVRPGKLRIVFNGLAFIGRDSDTALRTVLAAGREDRLWNVLHGFFASQGAENSGWVTDDLVTEIAAGIPGLDGQRLLSARWADAIDPELERASAAAEAAGVQGTPAFQLARKGEQPYLLQLESLGPEGIVPAIEDALAR